MADMRNQHRSCRTARAAGEAAALSGRTRNADGTNRLIAREASDISRVGFGAEVRVALDRRINTLTDMGLARRDGDKVTI